MASSCVFCKIIKGQIPSHKILETERILAFLDVNPLNRGHALVIPKTHSQFMHQVADEDLAEVLPAAKKIAIALGTENYNLLQNNGRLAHQAVDHVHFHVIPKDANGGLEMSWDPQESASENLSQLAKSIAEKL